MTFKNIVAKGEIAHNEHFFPLATICSTLSNNNTSFKEIFNIFAQILAKSPFADILHEKGQ